MELVKHWAARLDDYVIDLAWSPDGAQLAAASAAGPVALYDAQSGTLQHQLAAHDEGTNCIAWQPLAARALEQGAAAHAPAPILGTGGQEPRVKLWDAGVGQHIATAELGEKSGEWVEHLAWQPRSESDTTGAAVCAAASGRQLHLLRADGSVLHRLAPAPKSISALAWSPDGTRLASAYFGGVQLWDSHALALEKELPYAGGIQALIWSPDGRWLVSGNHDPSVHLWQPAADLELQMSGYETRVGALAFDPGSRWLATSGSTDCCVWDCSGPGPEGREPAMLNHGARLCALAFQNRSGGLLAAGSEDGAVKLWSIGGAPNPSRSSRSSGPLRATVTMPAVATKLAWSPDDSLLAIGTRDGTLYTLRYRA
ncbi:hypothetical protein AXK11_00800 [Cephaloticoccus primus]|uniref:Anaphase-promoting complex subunit 4-like WD40 domain-containing protein n=1 Tax=Cephaloticoccus primus TaxID=1548207 RepID=A0A139SUF6_9BACT|nr:WD40 repeat domain-containing protein [Cephaloticoccus primus]KXU38223.1 hypothetical protein AXK11_00800 [Cephaloticoccus primus]